MGRRSASSAWKEALALGNRYCRSDGGRAILASQAASLTSRSAASLEDYARALAAAPADGHYAVR